MKLNKFFIGLLFVVICSCVSSNESQHDIAILVDNTEKDSTRKDLLSPEGILHLMKSSYGTVTFHAINATTLNKDEEISLSGGPSGETDFQKKRRVDNFSKKLLELSNKYLGPAIGTDASNIYEPLCKSLNTLSESDADQKTLIVISDMIENSPHGNFYKHDKSFEEIQKQLDSTCKVHRPKNASDIRIIIVFDPKGDVRMEAKHDYAMEIWDKIFKKMKVKYQVVTNL